MFNTSNLAAAYGLWNNKSVGSIIMLLRNLRFYSLYAHGVEYNIVNLSNNVRCCVSVETNLSLC